MMKLLRGLLVIVLEVILLPIAVIRIAMCNIRGVYWALYYDEPYSEWSIPPIQTLRIRFKNDYRYILPGE